MYCRASFEKAKVIGRRNTFMDGMFAIVFNRDLELMDMVLRLALYLVVNISCAMFLMFWIFVYRLPSYIWTFGATWVRISGPLFSTSCDYRSFPLQWKFNVTKLALFPFQMVV